MSTFYDELAFERCVINNALNNLYHDYYLG